jgi:hypothetical protein
MTRDQIADINPDLLVMDGFDDCILGICDRFGGDQFVVYDYAKVIAKLESMGMTHDEAVEYHEFNQLGAYVGDHTPAFMTTSL